MSPYQKTEFNQNVKCSESHLIKIKKTVSDNDYFEIGFDFLQIAILVKTSLLKAKWIKI